MSFTIDEARGNIDRQVARLLYCSSTIPWAAS
jgi:hypothetical protein